MSTFLASACLDAEKFNAAVPTPCFEEEVTRWRKNGEIEGEGKGGERGSESKQGSESVFCFGAGCGVVRWSLVEQKKEFFCGD